MNKIIGFICLTFIALSLSFFLTFNNSNLKNNIIKSDYIKVTTALIQNEMSYYIDASVYNQVITEKQVMSDVNNSLNYFFNNKKIDKERLINNNKEIFKLEIENYLEEKDLEVVEDSVSVLSSNLSNVYISNIFIIDELNTLVYSFHKLSTLLLVGLLISIIIVISILYYDKNNKTKRLIFSTSFIMILVISVLVMMQSIYYINDQTSSFINNIILEYSLYNIMIASLYFIIYLILLLKEKYRKE
jgi:ABC-type sugar transport system permease subunit